MPSEAVYLKCGIVSDVLEMTNPFTFQASEARYVMNYIWEPLYTFAPETFEYIPWMADGMYQLDLENKTCIVTLKKGIKWSDGRPVTADDVVFTANVILDFKIPHFYRYFEFIKSVKRVDTYTVLYTLKEMRSTFIFGTLMQPIFPKHIWEPVVEGFKGSEDPQKALLDFKPTIDMMVGDGMFIPKEWIRNDHVLSVVNSYYFARGREVKGRSKKYVVGPYVDGIYYKLYKSTDAAILALLRGEIDYIWSSIGPDKLPLIALNSSVILTKLPENSICYLSWNLRKRPFNDVRFRKALAYLIDKPYIRSKILRNMGIWLSTVVPPYDTYWYNPFTIDYGNRDEMGEKDRIMKAKEILKGAGYSWNKEGKLLYPDGTPVEPFTILTPSFNYNSVRMSISVLIKRWWEKIGLSVTLIPTSPSNIVNKVFMKREFDCWISGWRLPLFPDYLRAFFASKEDFPGGGNPEGYHNDEFDKEADLFVRTLDVSKAREVSFELQKILQDELPYVPLYVRTIVEVHSRRSIGWIEQLNGIGNRWSLAFLKIISE